MFKINHGVTIAASAALCTSASAQLVLTFDVNGFDYEFTDAAGASSFGGENHTGSLDWTFATSPVTVIADARIGEDGRFGQLLDVVLGASLADFDANFDFDSGRIQGGDVTITLDNGDTYTADLAPGIGRIMSMGPTGGFMIDGLTLNGRFSDDQFGDIDVTEFTRIQDEAGMLPGSLFAFRFDPGAGASGTADAEVFVLVPLPPAAYAGLATLAGVIGLSYIRRRR